MLYRLFILLFLTLMPALLMAQQAVSQPQAERHYRVELIVVRHLAGTSDSAPQDELRDLSEVLDLYAPVDEDASDAASKSAVVDKGAEADLITEGSAEVLPEDIPEEVPEEPLAVRIDDMSDTMREAWRRLRLSSGFRPELFRAWEQSGDSPFPQLRIHDDEVLFEIVPAELPPAAQVDEYGALVFSDETVHLQQDEDQTDSLGTGDLPVPPPRQLYYRIDGTAALARTRFLHLDLDIELREPLFEQEPDSPVVGKEEGYTEGGSGKMLADTKVGPAAAASSFRLHHIAQRRQVKSEQMEYFDGPVIGVLAFVTGFDVVPEDTDAVESPQPDPVP